METRFKVEKEERVKKEEKNKENCTKNAFNPKELEVLLPNGLLDS